MDKKLALIRNSSILKLFVYISTIICIVLRAGLFFCSVNILFNIEEIDTLKQTVLYKSAFLDRLIQQPARAGAQQSQAAPVPAQAAGLQGQPQTL